VYDDYFILLAVDEAQTSASGCSIDKATRFVQDLGQSLNLNFLEKRRYFYRNGDEPIHAVDHPTMQAAVQDGIVAENTLVADTLLTQVGDLHRLWLPFGQSWHRRLFGR
jgi:hypothetical protein